MIDPTCYASRSPWRPPSLSLWRSLPRASGKPWRFDPSLPAGPLSGPHTVAPTGCLGGLARPGSSPVGSGRQGAVFSPARSVPVGTPLPCMMVQRCRQVEPPSWHVQGFGKRRVRSDRIPATPGPHCAGNPKKLRIRRGKPAIRHADQARDNHHRKLEPPCQNLSPVAPIRGPRAPRSGDDGHWIARRDSRRHAGQRRSSHLVPSQILPIAAREAEGAHRLGGGRKRRSSCLFIWS